MMQLHKSDLLNLFGIFFEAEYWANEHKCADFGVPAILHLVKMHPPKLSER